MVCVNSDHYIIDFLVKYKNVANINRQFDKSSTELSTIHIGIRIDDF